MKRPTHYCAHGSHGLAFSCFMDELRAHIASAREIPMLHGWTRTVYDLPVPKRNTDLLKVTCAECWRNINEMHTEFQKERSNG